MILANDTGEASVFSLAYLRVLNGLQKASAQHAPSAMQIPFPDVKLHINWLFTLFFFSFFYSRQEASPCERVGKG